jgi:hypothetical protein
MSGLTYQFAVGILDHSQENVVDVNHIVDLEQAEQPEMQSLVLANLRVFFREKLLNMTHTHKRMRE